MSGDIEARPVTPVGAWRLKHKNPTAAGFLVAEVYRSLANFRIPDPQLKPAGACASGPSLLDQAEGKELLRSSWDDRPRMTWRVSPQTARRVLELYESGISLSAIARECKISWESVAKILDREGVRVYNHVKKM